MERSPMLKGVIFSWGHCVYIEVEGGGRVPPHDAEGGYTRTMYQQDLRMRLK